MSLALLCCFSLWCFVVESSPTKVAMHWSKTLVNLSDLSLQDLAHAPIMNGLTQQLQKAFPDEPALLLEDAIASGLVRALADENLGVQEIICTRNYATLCPEGAFFFA